MKKDRKLTGKEEKSAASPDPLQVLEAELRAALARISGTNAATCWKRGLLGPGQWLALGPPQRLEALGLSSLNLGMCLGEASPDCLQEVFGQLAKDEDWRVRKAVAENSTWLCCTNRLRVEFPLTPSGFMA